MSEEVVLSEQDEADLHRLHTEPDGIEPPSFHPILQVWREVLAPAEGEMTKPISPNWANRIVSSYTEITFNDMGEFRTRYFTKLLQLATIIDTEIATDPDCLTYTTPAEDVENNAHHYKNLLMNWQMAVLEWELEWDTMDQWAAVELAAISEVHKMFFGDQGLTAFLDNIGFEFGEDDQQLLVEALEGLRGERE